MLPPVVMVIIIRKNSNAVTYATHKINTKLLLNLSVYAVFGELVTRGRFMMTHNHVNIGSCKQKLFLFVAQATVRSKAPLGGYISYTCTIGNTCIFEEVTSHTNTILSTLYN